MRNAETVLATLRARGQRGAPVRDLYRMLFIPDLYLRAYHKLYPNRGALTPGATPETVDGMSLAKIDQLIDDVRHERHHWTPARRVYISKRNGHQRPLGIPTWKDKLLQEVIRSLLEAYYEPQFSSLSHGFRPQRGCHTALQTIQTTWKGTRWFIEGDLSSYFDTINHTVLLRLLSEQLLGLDRVRLGHILTGLGLNALRLGEWFLGLERPKSRVTPFMRLMAGAAAA